MPFGLVLVN